jgi:hypothetical protein
MSARGQHGQIARKVLPARIVIDVLMERENRGWIVILVLLVLIFVGTALLALREVWTTSTSRAPRPQTAQPIKAPSSQASAVPTSTPATTPATAVVTTAVAPTPAEPPPPPSTPGMALRTVLEEDFTTNQRQWPDNPQATAWITDGAYHLFARQPGQFVAIGAPMTESLRDVVVTASFRKVGGPPGGGYGVIVRDQGPGPRDGLNQGGQYYVLEAGDRGEVGIWRREGEHWVELVPWTPSEAVRLGDAANELRVQAVGQRLIFLVNGTEVANVEDSVLPEGGMGVFVGGDFNEVLLDRFVVQAPGQPLVNP